MTANKEAMADEQIFALAEKHIKFSPEEILKHDADLLTFARALLAAMAQKGSK